ncbi:BTAD domain-containing putative transcriptional regulator [Plantactinospora solaniradicis]|uniref:BTAD domain-containing putative transcriptional regulator n=1 Tax=Plantactinospora solaniradicis TaxID=1723736 RepID=A0ABW1KG55_9ACTN
MEFRLLGPVEIRSASGDVIRLGRRRERLALAVLLLEPQRVVSAERLIALVWGDASPTSARTTLQSMMSRVRSALRSAVSDDPDEPVRLLARGGGYLLAAPPESVDLHRFVGLVHGARAIREPTLRSAQLAEALNLWRGPALADAADAAVRDRLCGSLEEARLAAISDRIDADFDAGRHADLVPELSRLTCEHPLRERLHSQLVTALHRCDRHADALEAYRRAHRLLVTELGVEPGPQLRAAQASVIAHSPNTDAESEQPNPPPTAPVVPAQLPPGPAGFVGRDGYIQQLDTVLAGEASATRIYVITGAAGVGKTTLAVRWARRAAARFPDGVLFVDMHGFHTGPQTTPAEALPLLLGALGVAADRVPVRIEAQTALYRSMLARRRVLVLLDNVADAHQVRPLVPGDPGCLVLVTSRDRLSGLVARDGAHRLTLDVLPPGDAVDVLAHVVGADRVGADPHAAAELAELCGRLPLALRIAGARLVDRPNLELRRQVEELATRGRMTHLRIDGDENATVCGAFDLSYQALASPVRRLFRFVSLVPAPTGLSFAAAAALAGLSAADVEPLADVLARLHLVTVAADNRLAAHDLLLEYAAALTATYERAADRDTAIDRLLAFYVHTADRAGAVLSGSPWPQLPRDPLPAGVTPIEIADEDQARQWLVAEWANLVAAVDYAATSGRDRTAWHLVDALRAFIQLQAPLTQALSIAHTGLVAAQRAGDLLGEATMRHSVGFLRLWRTAEFQAAIDEFDTGAALFQQAAWQQGQIAAMCTTGIALVQLGQLWPAIRRLEQALAVSREIGDEVGELRSLTNLAGTYEAVGALTQAAQYCERALPLLRRSGRRQGEIVALIVLAKVRRHQGRLEPALHTLLESLSICRGIGARHEEADLLTALGLVHRDAGRYDAATVAFTTSLDIAKRLSDSRHEVSAHIGLASVEIRQGHLESAAKRLDAALETVERIGYHRRRFEALQTKSELYLAFGDHRSAHEHATRALALASESGYTLAVGQAQSLLAVSSIGLDCPAQALEHCRRALATQRRAGQRLAQAGTLLTAGRAYQRLGKTPLARSRWRQAHTLFSEVGAPEHETTTALLTLG